MRLFIIALGITSCLIIGYLVGSSSASKSIDREISHLKRTTTSTIANVADLNARQLVLMEHPALISRIMEGGAFGNENFSVHAAQNMFSKDEKAIDDIIDKTTVLQIKPGIWLIRFPIVNCVLVETNEGLVLFDTGMKPAGPALLKTVRGISNKRIHTIIYTHGHVDHCYGTWSLIEDGEDPQIIAHESIKRRFNRYLKMRGSISKYMSQPLDQMPKDSLDIVWPTTYFMDSLKLTIGDVEFQLFHFDAETDDQLFAWMPNEKVLMAADYYQGFLPNAGNGKRVQRNVESWTEALKKMASLQPEFLLPMHGEHLYDRQLINTNLSLVAETLDFIVAHTLNGLNAGSRKDQIYQSLELPDRLKNHPLLKPEYVTAKDISKMIIRQYTGWWDDIPSHWSPETMENQAKTIVKLAGGIDQLLEFTTTMIESNLVLASHLIDYAWLAEPQNEEVQLLALEIYRQRIMHEESVTQEMLVYLDHMATIRANMD